MAILLEGLNLVVRRMTLEVKYPGGVTAYMRATPNGSAITDSYLVRIGFMCADDANGFVQYLTDRGLRLWSEDSSPDIAIVDHAAKLRYPCTWINLGWESRGVMMAWLIGTEPGPLVTPSGWTPSHERLRFVSNEESQQYLQFIRGESDFDLYLDKRTNQLLWVGRVRDEMHTIDSLFLQGKKLVYPYLVFEGRTPHNAFSPSGQRDLSEGIRCFERILTIDSGEFAALWYLGKVYEAMHQVSQSYTYFQKAYESDPSNIDGIREYVRKCLELGRGTEAVAAAHRACILRPGDSGLLANYALALLISGDAERAFTVTQDALRRSPSDQITQNLFYYVKSIRNGEIPCPTRLE